MRYSEGIDSVEGDAAKALEAQAAKRVAISFPPARTAHLGPSQARRHLLRSGQGGLKFGLQPGRTHPDGTSVTVFC